MFKKLFEEIFYKTDIEKLCSLCDRTSFWSRNTKGIKQLLESSVDLDIDTLDDIGMSPLHYAISNKYHDAIDLLLRHGANPRLPDKSGSSPLGYAFKLHYKSYINDSKLIIVKLIKAGILANIMTVKMLLSYYQYDEEILITLFSKERNQRGFNRGHMVDVDMLMKILKQKHISKQVLKVLFSFRPIIKTKSADSSSPKNKSAPSGGVEYQEYHDAESLTTSASVIMAITNHMKRPMVREIG
jgi:hypothetical protein